MSTLSSIVTIAAPPPAVTRLHGVPPLAFAGALLPEPVDSTYCSISFAADLDGAEKGNSFPQSKAFSMRRSTTAKTNIPPPLQLPNPVEKAEPEEGSSTGVDVNHEHDDPIKDVPKLNIEISEDVLSSPGSSSGITVDAKTARSHEEKETSRADIVNYEKLFDARNYETYPIGWPQFAAFLNSDDSFAIFRRFGTAHCRVLLHLQVEITAIEKALLELDQRDESNPSMQYRLHRHEWRQGWDTAQKDLLDKLRSKLSEYDDILLKDSKLRALASAPVRDHEHVYNWVNNCKPLDAGEYDFIFCRDDFISSANKLQSGFDGFIESCLSRWPDSQLQKFLRDKKQVHGTQDSAVHYFSSAKIALVARLMAVCVAVIILLIPVLLLFLTNMSKKMTSMMVIIFVLAFATLMSLFTGAKIESVFVGTCTYCAVLVTFLGNVQGGVGATAHP